MSEFFKALEQAERDRELVEQNEREVTREQALRPDSVEGPVAAPPPEAAAAAPPVVAAPPAPVGAPPLRPGLDGDARPSFFERPPARREDAGADRRPARAAGQPAPAPPVEPAHATLPPVAAPVEEARPPREAAAREPVAPARAADWKPSEPVVPGRVTGAAKKPGRGPVLIADLDPRSVAAEAYRTLRANLEFIPSERGCRHIVITSPSMGEGKSTTVANLAVVAAQTGSRVCLVDADMRRPTLHTLFGMRNHGGFTRALSQALPLASVATPTEVPNLSLVVAGSADGLQPAHLLNTPRVQKVLHDPATPFDLVLFDTPPIISVADALNLAAHCDGVLVVVRAGAVPPSVLRQAVRQIEQAKGRVLGVVLNRVDLRRGDAEFYRYYSAYYAGAKKD